MTTRQTEYAIDSDGITVWVNGAYCLGRFGRYGIDIHREPTRKDVGECLLCTHGEVTAEDWDVFVVKMRELHGVEVPEKHRPVRFRP